MKTKKIRSDSVEARFGLELLEEKIEEYYLGQLMSAKDTAIAMTNDGITVSDDTVLRLVSKFGVRRSKAMAISLVKSTLPRVKMIDDEMESIIDGIVIGDGHIRVNNNTKIGRVVIGSMYEEFALYCQKLLSRYKAQDPHYNSGEKGIGMWETKTLHHIDFYEQHQRWYPGGVKDIPSDIRFTPMMLTLWHLGDGCLSSPLNGNARYMYFSTNSFSRESLENIVVPKFAEIGVEVSRITEDNRVFIATKSIAHLLKFMGGKSPVSCFDYKFDIEEWRAMTSMRQAAESAGLSYGRLSNWVKNGLIEHSRSPGGKKVVFTEDQLSSLRSRVDSGELPIESGKKRRVVDFV